MIEDQTENSFHITELGMLPNGWEIVELGDILHEVDLRCGDVKGVSINKIPVLSLTKDFGIILQSDRFHKRIAVDDISSYKYVKKGWFVYNPYVIWEGAIHILKNYEFGAVSPVYPIWQLSDKANPLFIDYLLRTPLLLESYLRLCSGVVKRRRSISKQSFLSIKIPFPSLIEQVEIGKILSSVQKSKETTENCLKVSGELRKSMMRHLFTYGAVSVTKAEDVILKETVIGLFPDNWNIVRFEEAVTIKSGQVDPKKYPYSKMLNVGPENIEVGTGRILNAKSAEELKLISGKYLFAKNDVLYSKIRPYLRKAAFATFDGICSADMYAMTSDVLDHQYLLTWLLSDPFTTQAVSYQSRTGIPKINRKQLGSTFIPIPPKQEQQAITTVRLISK